MADQGVASFVGGAMDAINGYIGKQQETNENIRQYKAEKDIDAKANKTDPMYVDAESVGKLWDTVDPKMGQAARSVINGYNTDPRNKNQPLTWEMYKNELQGQIEKVGDLQEKGKPTYSFIGNTADGLPILADKRGNMKLGDGTDAEYTGKVFPKTSNMPTTSTRSSAEFASSVRDHIKEMRPLIQEADAKGYIGPAAGRYQSFMAGKVGSTGDPDADALLGQLRSYDSLIKTAAMRVHFGARGGQQMFDHFSDILNSGKQSAAMLNGELDTLDKFMAGYQKAGSVGGGSGAPENQADLAAKKAALRAKLQL